MTPTKEDVEKMAFDSATKLYGESIPVGYQKFFKDGYMAAASLNMQGCRWEIFCDSSYYHLWAVRPENDRSFQSQKLFHVQSEAEAKALQAILNGINLSESIEPCATSSENYWKQRCEAAEKVFDEFEEDTNLSYYNSYRNWEKLKSQTPSPTGDRDCEELKEENDELRKGIRWALDNPQSIQLFTVLEKLLK